MPVVERCRNLTELHAYIPVCTAWKGVELTGVRRTVGCCSTESTEEGGPCSTHRSQ